MAYIYGHFGKYETLDKENEMAFSAAYLNDSNKYCAAQLTLLVSSYRLIKFDSDGDLERYNFHNESFKILRVNRLPDSSDLIVTDSCCNEIVMTQEQYDVLANHISITDKNAERELLVSEIDCLDLDSMSGVEFEKIILHLVKKMGFDAQITKASGDGGVDIIAINNQPFLEGKYIIQCKRWNSSVGEPILRDLYGVVMSERANKGILVTTSYFTANAVSFAEGKPIELIDGRKLKNLISQYITEYNAVARQIRSHMSEKYPMNQDTYNIIKNELNSSPDNHELRCRLVEMLAATILGADIYDEESMLFRSKYTVGEQDFLVSECRKQFSFFENMKTNDKRMIGVVKLSTLGNADLYLIQGNLVEAISRYSQLLYWERLSTRNYDGSYHDSENLYPVIFNVLQIYNILGLTHKAEILYNKYANAFNDVLEWGDDGEKLQIRNYQIVSSVYIARLWDGTGRSSFMYDSYRIITARDNKTREHYIFPGYGFGRSRRIVIDSEQNACGIEGYHMWNKSVIGSMDEMRKKIDILF